MTTQANGPDKLERLLRRDASLALADDGFTVRVVAALPARAETIHHTWLKPALVLGSAALGSALAVAFAPAGSNVVQGFFDLAARHPNTPAAMAGLALSGTLLLCAIVLALDTE
jgi:hypothetical protein